MIDKLLNQRLSLISRNVFPLVAPDNHDNRDNPIVIYNCLHCDPVRSIDSAGSEWAHYIYQIDAYDPSYLKAQNLAAAIRQSLVTWTDSEVKSAAWTGTTAMVDKTTEVFLYRAMSTFVIFAKV